MNNELFTVDNFVSPPPTESLPPAQVRANVYKHVEPGLPIEISNDLYHEGIGILTNFVNGYKAGNAEQMKEAASRLGDIQRAMYRAGSEVSLSARDK